MCPRGEWACVSRVMCLALPGCPGDRSSLCASGWCVASIVLAPPSVSALMVGLAGLETGGGASSSSSAKSTVPCTAKMESGYTQEKNEVWCVGSADLLGCEVVGLCGEVRLRALGRVLATLQHLVRGLVLAHHHLKRA